MRRQAGTHPSCPANRACRIYRQGKALNVYHFIIHAFLLFVFFSTLYLSCRGDRQAKSFLWTWAVLLALAFPFSPLIPGTVTSHTAVVMVLFFVYTLLLIGRKSRETIVTAHEETRRVLAQSNNRMDEERRRIARRLHDEINPGLLLARLELQNLGPLVSAGIGDREQARKAQDIIAKVNASLTCIYQECREIIRHTRIEIIDSIGFTTALESLVDHYRQILERPAIVLEHNLPKRPVMPLPSAVNAYRILQEALLNAVKHADAASIRISVQQAGKRFSIVVADDGIGISARNGQGIGLIDMRERARVLEADLRIESRRGEGTRISFSFLPRD